MRDIVPPGNLKQKIKAVEIQSPMPHCRAFKVNSCSVLVGQEPDIGWHLSISHPKRYPTWDEIKFARYQFMPGDITVAMLLPPPDRYVNVYDTCFHLHQI